MSKDMNCRAKKYDNCNIVCRAAAHDGIRCPQDSCDYEDGTREPPAVAEPARKAIDAQGAEDVPTTKLLKDEHGKWTVEPISPLPAATLGKAGERESFIAWLKKSFPNLYSSEMAERLWNFNDLAALAWQARSSLSQQPVASDVRNAAMSEVTVMLTSFLSDVRLHAPLSEGAIECAIEKVRALQSTPAVQADEGDKS